MNTRTPLTLSSGEDQGGTLRSTGVSNVSRDVGGRRAIVVWFRAGVARLRVMWQAWSDRPRTRVLPIMSDDDLIARPGERRVVMNGRVIITTTRRRNNVADEPAEQSTSTAK